MPISLETLSLQKGVKTVGLSWVSSPSERSRLMPVKLNRRRGRKNVLGHLCSRMFKDLLQKNWRRDQKNLFGLLCPQIDKDLLL
ncbi:hypothetical protein DPMN_014025 [Dreissena polymorpha]|uniref:Uncharacterized protein n=1 Tax=Dreissena polymorpha TaxID=45954 RepID=A0A9D4N8M9_DREPO|nr:hypothetical protein DPMN_014025 [Dreissena polymorpha]